MSKKAKLDIILFYTSIIILIAIMSFVGAVHFNNAMIRDEIKSILEVDKYVEIDSEKCVNGYIKYVSIEKDGEYYIIKVSKIDGKIYQEVIK